MAGGVLSVVEGGTNNHSSVKTSVLTPIKTAPSTVTAPIAVPTGSLGNWRKCLPAVTEEPEDGVEEEEASSPRSRATSVASRCTIASVAPPEGLGDVENLENAPAVCGEVIERLETGSRAERRSIVVWLLPALKELAVGKHGCRVVQKAVEAASGKDRDLIISELVGCVKMLYESPHGNYVLTKMVEVMPPASLSFVIDELSGDAVAVAKHRFGCRVLERLIEHFPAAQIECLVAEVVVESKALSQHKFGNFVVQHLLEHGADDSSKAVIVECICGSVAELSRHRQASHVVQRALEFGDANVQQAVAKVLLVGDGDDAVELLACSQYGSFVVEALVGMRGDNGAEVRRRLAETLPQLLASKHGAKLAERIGLVVTDDSA